MFWRGVIVPLRSSQIDNVDDDPREFQAADPAFDDSDIEDPNDGNPFDMFGEYWYVGEDRQTLTHPSQRTLCKPLHLYLQYPEHHLCLNLLDLLPHLL